MALQGSHLIGIAETVAVVLPSYMYNNKTIISYLHDTMDMHCVLHVTDTVCVFRPMKSIKPIVAQLLHLARNVSP